MKLIFPAVYSTLCPEALAALISDKYGIHVTQCKLIVRGVGDTYSVSTVDERFILRIYRSSHRNLAQIKEEVQLLLALKDAGISVSYPILDIAGQAILEIDAAEGLRHAVLFSYASGKVVRTPDESQLLNLGQEIARFHNVSSNMKEAGVRWNFNYETTVLNPLKMIEGSFKDDPEGYDWLQKAANIAQYKLSQFSTPEFSTGYCHFDFLPKNFHFDDDRVTIFDFDFMGYGWLVNDIMTFWQHLILEVYTGRMTQLAADEAYNTFLAGYRNHRSISEEELAAVPYLSLGFWLFYMGFHTTHDQFILFTHAPHVKSYLGILKHIVEVHWTKDIED